MRVRDAYKVLVYLTTRRTELEKDVQDFEGSCTTQEFEIRAAIDEVNKAIDFIVENCK